MRILPVLTLIFAASCAPPLHPEYAGAETLYERDDVREVVRAVFEKQFGVESENDRSITSAWSPRYDKDEDVHYRLRAIASIAGSGPYRIDLRVTREDKDFVSGRWRPKGPDPGNEEQLRRDIHRALGRR
jgi:hypothetical protein